VDKMTLHAESVERIAPVSAEVASMAPQGRVASGEAVTCMTGELAMVGEFEELWWVARKQAFFVDGKTGFVGMELRRVFLRMDSIRAVVERKAYSSYRRPDGTTVQLPDEITCDWTKTREFYRQKGWLRVDPVFKKHGITPNGVMTNHQYSSVREEHYKVLDQACKPEVLADIAKMNYAHYPATHAGIMKANLLKQLQKAVEQIERRPDRMRPITKLKEGCQKWVDAMQEANNLVENPPTPSDDEDAAPIVDIPTVDDIKTLLADPGLELDRAKEYLFNEVGSEKPRKTAIDLITRKIEQLEEGSK